MYYVEVQKSFPDVHSAWYEFSDLAKAIDLAMEGCLEVSKLQKEALMKKYSTE